MVVDKNNLSINTEYKDHNSVYELTFKNGIEHFKTTLIMYLFELQPICKFFIIAKFSRF